MLGEVDVEGMPEESESDKSEEITDYKRGKLGSSIGRAEFKFKGKKYLLPVKGTGKDSDTDTDVKEALVSMF